jgi:hypothetical protein
MARIPKQGVALASLNEKDKTLSEVISDLRFRKLRLPDEWTVRTDLGFAIGSWRMSGAKGAWPALTVEEVAQLCAEIGRELAKIGKVLGAVNGGIQNNLHVEVTARIAQAAAESGDHASIHAGYDLIKSFVEPAELIAKSALAASRVRQPQRRGRDRQDWYMAFIDVAARVCTLNGVKPSLSTDSRHENAGGRFLAALEAFETLLPKEMRAPSTAARVQRFRRWRRERRGSRPNIK